MSTRKNYLILASFLIIVGFLSSCTKSDQSIQPNVAGLQPTKPGGEAIPVPEQKSSNIGAKSQPQSEGFNGDYSLEILGVSNSDIEMMNDYGLPMGSDWDGDGDIYSVKYVISDLNKVIEPNKYLDVISHNFSLASENERNISKCRDSSINPQYLVGGERVKGAIIFVVPNGSKPKYLEFNDDNSNAHLSVSLSDVKTDSSLSIQQKCDRSAPFMMMNQYDVQILSYAEGVRLYSENFDEKRFKAVAVKVKVTAKEETFIPYKYLQLIDTNGYAFSPSFTTGIEGYEALSEIARNGDSKITAGQIVEGWIPFIIPKDSKPAYLRDEYGLNFFSLCNVVK